MDLELLLNNLSVMSSEDYDNILEGRDSEPFDSSWCELNNLIGGNETHPDGKNIFIKISTITKQHEITSYIADPPCTSCEIPFSCALIRPSSWIIAGLPSWSNRRPLSQGRYNDRFCCYLQLDGPVDLSV